MKLIPTATAALFLGVTSALIAQEGRPHGKRDKRPSREDILKRFDLDKDGELSEEERQTAREARSQRRGGNERPEEAVSHGRRGQKPHDGERFKRQLEKFDRDKDGKLSDEERRIARDTIAKGFGQRGDKMREHMLNKFDKDGDGKLSDGERKHAHKEMQRHRVMMSDRMKKAKKRFMAKFDTDRDGVISEEEKVAAKIDVDKRTSKLKHELILKHDADGDGHLSEDERRRAHEKEKQEMLDRFDADKDGELNEEEKKVAFDYMLEHQPYRLMHQMKRKKGGSNHGERGAHPHSKSERAR
ncbi:MAG: hypothetical protein ABGY95_00515 [Rubritalea sp.]|uniref:hypothetical protein n=1 Tax=Rubritalea sp. TaxID=2109375 RepID=UPI003242506E